jgi:hypothetical protein
MAQLTWRDMAAPDLGTSLQGYNQFSNLINSSLGGARNEIDKIDSEQKDALNNRVALAAVQEQDPVKLKAALESGTILGGANPNRLSAQTIAMLGQRPGQLLQQANQELSLKDNTRLYDQAVTADAKAPQIAQARMLAYKGDSAGLQAHLAANPGLLDGLGYKNVNDFITNTQNDAKSGVDLTNSKDQNTRAWHDDARAQGRYGMEKTEFGWKTTDRATEQAAQGLLAGVVENSDPNNPDSIRNSLFNGPLSHASPQVRALVYSRLPPALSAALSPDQLAAGANTGFVGGPSVGNAATIQVGGGQMPSSVQSFADAISYGKNTLIPATRNDPKYGLQGTGKGTSAMGMYQITSSTLADWAPKVFKGQDLSKISFTDPANQDKIAQAIFNANKGDPSALAQQWTSLKNPAAVARMPWSQAREVIARGESGGSPASVIAGSAPGVVAGVTLRSAQERAGKTDAGRLMSAASGPDANPLDVVAGLHQPGSRFEKTNTGFIKDQLDDIVNRSKVNGTPTITYAMAGEILNRSASENRGSHWNLDSLRDHLGIPGSTSTSGNSVKINAAGDRLNRDFITGEIARIKKGGLPQEAARSADLQWKATHTQQTQDQVYAENAKLQALLMRLPSQPGLINQVNMQRAKVGALQAQTAAVQQDASQSAGPIAESSPNPNGNGVSIKKIWDDVTSGNLFTLHR